MEDCIGTTDFRIPDPTVVAIGKFDGDHRGHRKILNIMRGIAAEKNLKTAVFTFATPPAKIVSGDMNPQISTNCERRKKLKESGIDYIVEYPFTAATADMSAADFVRDILIGRMNMKAIVAGTDCSFGKNRSGNAAFLREAAKQYGFEARIIEKEKEFDRDISSTYIRETLEKGDVELANEMLGDVYSIEGRVVGGNHIGSAEIGYPTVNLIPPEGKLLPKNGVYRTEVRIPGDGEKCYRGITNVGENPSVLRDRLNHRVRVETFLLDFQGDLYGKKVRVSFLKFIRPEKKFDSLAALREQIRKDVADNF